VNILTKPSVSELVEILDSHRVHRESVSDGGLGVAHLDPKLPIRFPEMPLGFRDDLATREGSGFHRSFALSHAINIASGLANDGAAIAPWPVVP